MRRICAALAAISLLILTACGGSSGHNPADATFAQQMVPHHQQAVEMGSLGKVTGTAFDTQWLTLMTKHHQGAIAMARTELKDGWSTDAKKLARSIISVQEKEIAMMKELLR